MRRTSRARAKRCSTGNSSGWRTSLKAAGDREKLCFLHYPPCYTGYCCQPILDLLTAYGVRACYYGHLHGASHRLALQGNRDGVDYHLVAADYLRFHPEKILE